MSNIKSLKKGKMDRGEKLFRLLLIFVIIEFVIFLGVKLFTGIRNMQISIDEKRIEKRERILAENESATGYKKILYIQDLENTISGMYRFERVEKISEIFDGLKNISDESSSMINLSEFNISLDEISLKGSVSTLKALYYTSPSGKFEALLNRFKDLDFIKNMSIKTYERPSANEDFEFILYANVVPYDGE